MLKFVLSMLVAVHAQADIVETPTLQECLTQAEADSVGMPPNDVVYAFDIDNTVLGLNQNLGSVQWFRWQSSLIQNGIEEGRVADNVDDLLKKQGLLYHLSGSQPPEPTIAQAIEELQRNGHSVLYHTSRNPSVRDVTERELKKSQLIPLQKTIGPSNGYPGSFMYPKDLAAQRAVTFQNGVYMSDGQDKGVWLTLLLEKTETSSRHIVFVDDELKNLKNVERAFAGKTPTTLCRYGKMDTVVDAFNQSDKKNEIELWKVVSDVVAQFL